LLAVLYITGKKKRIVWMIGIINQAAWLAYSIQTEQWGFLPGVVLVGGMYIKNWVDWGREVPPEPQIHAGVEFCDHGNSCFK
jgi:hypothetical protein